MNSLKRCCILFYAICLILLYRPNGYVHCTMPLLLQLEVPWAQRVNPFLTELRNEYQRRSISEERLVQRANMLFADVLMYQLEDQHAVFIKDAISNDETDATPSDGFIVCLLAHNNEARPDTEKYLKHLTAIYAGKVATETLKVASAKAFFDLACLHAILFSGGKNSVPTDLGSSQKANKAHNNWNKYLKDLFGRNWARLPADADTELGCNIKMVTEIEKGFQQLFEIERSAPATRAELVDLIANQSRDPGAQDIFGEKSALFSHDVIDAVLKYAEMCCRTTPEDGLITSLITKWHPLQHSFLLHDTGETNFDFALENIDAFLLGAAAPTAPDANLPPPAPPTDPQAAAAEPAPVGPMCSVRLFKSTSISLYNNPWKLTNSDIVGLYNTNKIEVRIEALLKNEACYRYLTKLLILLHVYAPQRQIVLTLYAVNGGEQNLDGLEDELTKHLTTFRDVLGNWSIQRDTSTAPLKDPNYPTQDTYRGSFSLFKQALTAVYGFVAFLLVLSLLVIPKMMPLIIPVAIILLACLRISFMYSRYRNHHLLNKVFIAVVMSVLVAICIHAHFVVLTANTAASYYTAMRWSFIVVFVLEILALVFSLIFSLVSNRHRQDHIRLVRQISCGFYGAAGLLLVIANLCVLLIPFASVIQVVCAANIICLSAICLLAGVLLESRVAHNWEYRTNPEEESLIKLNKTMRYAALAVVIGGIVTFTAILAYHHSISALEGFAHIEPPAQPVIPTGPAPKDIAEDNFATYLTKIIDWLTEPSTATSSTPATTIPSTPATTIPSTPATTIPSTPATTTSSTPVTKPFAVSLFDSFRYSWNEVFHKP
ncbi:hypothetical protein NEHOM01_1932 [Nematocida homosporus]|uniref:uncharacterized protein n=1 Tax=Nematocida homosporus TaxID=1912981 RepID=UPI00221E9F5E|nr:uncharacterized protein NEHOM01_1932 [Nematocida homosporus]KAI5187101.1 hypothetical protein NEHOM01_1932 [Nematocida homosporus]